VPFSFLRRRSDRNLRIQLDVGVGEKDLQESRLGKHANGNVIG
jgi:hypothetical protein